MAIDTRKPKDLRRAWNRGRDLTRMTQGESADDWNKKHRIGTPVVVVRDDGSQVLSVTRSDAYLLGHGQAVILLEGFRGCYALDRVAPK